MAFTGLVTEKPANLILDISLLVRRLNRRDGVVDAEERRAEEGLAELSDELNTSHDTLTILMCGFRENGIDGPRFRRLLREHDEDRNGTDNLVVLVESGDDPTPPAVGARAA